jgi:hypothetical protein
MSDTFYKLLGRAVWNSGKFYLRTKYGRTYLPKPVLGGLLLAATGGVVLVAVRHNGSGE